MAKKATKQKKSNEKSSQKSKKIEKTQKKGRPTDNDLEKKLMSMIRGDKSQYINSQSKLEIKLSFHHRGSNTTDRKRHASGAGIAEEKQVQELNLVDELKNHFSLVDQKRKDFLLLLFQEKKQLWQFQEIQTLQDIPDYFFDDGSDIAFIMYEWIKQKKEIYSRYVPSAPKKTLPDSQHLSQHQAQVIKHSCLVAQELLFLFLLCLNQRDHLRRQTLNLILEKQNTIVNLIKYGMQVVFNLNKSSKKKNASESKLDQEDQSDDDQVDAQIEQQSEMSANQQEQRLIANLVDCLCWAYKYIFQEEISARNMAKKLFVNKTAQQNEKGNTLKINKIV